MATQTLTRAAPTSATAPDVVEMGGPDVLNAIHEPAITLAIWRRQLDPALSAWLDAAPTPALPHVRFVLAKQALPKAFDAAVARLPEGPERAALAADMVALAERFSEIAAAPRLRVRLEAVEGDACRRFHQDAVPARLLCTYRGPATQWGHAPTGETPEEIHALDRGDAAIWKGSEWPGAAPHTLVHRSPPIAGTGLARLLLVVDPADPWADDDWAEQIRPR